MKREDIVGVKMISNRIRVILVMVAGLVCLSTPMASGAHRPDEIVIKYKPGFRVRILSSANSVGAKLVNSLEQIRYQVFRLPKGLPLEEAIERFKQDPNVEYAGPNHLVSICRAPNDDWYQFMGIYMQWGLYNPENPETGIDAERAWDITTGSPDVIIAVVDTGVMIDHEDLYAKIVPGRNVITGAQDP
ncbi:MAG: S8 family serine peptidase [Armatimonadota bacterium]